MAFKILLHAIMTEARGSKSNIAAKFQNAFTVELYPPIGVFWDIENCQVPKGKSAIALVQNIREKFFVRHREAEFMCVCDIHKENNTIIQELISAQVTVVHISATSKNAADDKLKQCMRRFVDTHGAPATLLLISDDVNFATELSDFRHRHNIRIILLHRGYAHESLITCAHEHYNYSSVTNHLPSRSPVKATDNRPCELEVTDLPCYIKGHMIQSKLKRLSDNCGGKVLSLKGSKAIIHFSNAEAAARAQKRMDKEIVYGNRISVSFPNRNGFESNYASSNYQPRGSSYEASASSCSSRNSSVSPPRKANEYKMKSSKTSALTPKKQFSFPPPPLLNNQNCPTLLRSVNSTNDFSLPKSNSASYSTVLRTGITKGENNYDSMKNNKLMDCGITKCHDISAFSPFIKNQEPCVKPRLPQRNVGHVQPFYIQDCDMKSIQSVSPASVADSSHRNLNHCYDTNSFSMYANHGYPGVAQNIAMAYSDMPRINDSVNYSPQWNNSHSSLSEPAQVSKTMSMSPSDICSPVELYVSNLDPNCEVNEMKKILQAAFREHVMVLHISMSLQPDGSARATVKVPSAHDAQYAISQLHRKKIGHKRILISNVATDKNPPFHVLKSETVALLNDIPNKNLPLIKFRELYEKRYHRSLAVSELYKMRDAVTMQGDSTGRVVTLNTDYFSTPSLPDSDESQEVCSIERPYCEVHFRISDSEGWAEHYNVCPLPLVYISLKVLSTAVHTLLDSHQGSLPLISFCACYEAEIGILPVVGNCDSIGEKDHPVDLVPTRDNGIIRIQKGVPLEHLIACVTGVEVAKSAISIKKVQWLENRMPDIQASRTLSPALAGQLTLFGREVMDLLKNQPQCLVPFNKFIPTYHHHFGRQCRVADYGFTKLIDLLEAIPHIVQVLGEGQNRQVTLTHRTQVKRFTAELLRILKSRASKQITLSEFAIAYEQCIEKPFDITNYGVCEIEDMLDEVSENTIVRSSSGDEMVIAIPKREQTADEMERTKEFAIEVVELLKHTPVCSMVFNKFIPSYHHHFGKQCRVADYGFTKLIELFEAIPDVLNVEGTGDDKVLSLVVSEQNKILSERLVAVLEAQPNQLLDIDDLSSAYSRLHGHALRPNDFGCADLVELLAKMNALKVEDGFVRLVPLEMLVRDIIVLLEEHGNSILLSYFGSAYQKRYGTPLSIAKYGFASMLQVFEAFSQYFTVKGRKRGRIVHLNEGISLKNFASNKDLYKSSTRHKSSDLLSQPIPSCVPSPLLEPKVKPSSDDLMGFETPPVNARSSADSPHCNYYAAASPVTYRRREPKSFEDLSTISKENSDLLSCKSTPTRSRIAARFSFPIRD